MNTNTERDELAQTITNADTEYFDGVPNPAPTGRSLAAADAILAAGYSKPRTITTAEELDALPDGSAILDGSGDVGQKLSGWWHFPETAPMGSSKVAKYGPASVLYTPEPTK